MLDKFVPDMYLKSVYDIDYAKAVVIKNKVSEKINI